jgi:probable HAF family extracellular repeat protein
MHLLILATLLILLSPPVRAAPLFTVQELHIPGVSSPTSLDINESGQITGAGYIDGGTEWHAFRYGASMQDLGTLGGTGSGGFAINASGQVTGYAAISGNRSTHAFLYDGTMHDLGTLGGANSTGYGISDSGAVTGAADTNYSTRPYRYVHAFLYDGAIHNLGTPGPAYIGSVGTGINARNEVTGYAWTGSDFSDHAFLYDGTMHDLGTLGGAVSLGYGINPGGQVTGTADTASGSTHAFLYDGTMHDLGTLGGTSSSGIGINAHGQVTGSASLGNGDTHAFLYDNSAMRDLNGLLSPQDPLYGLITLDQGRRITDAGQILATGTGPDGYQTFLLTPVPEPAALALLSGGFLAIAGLRHHARRRHVRTPFNPVSTPRCGRHPSSRGASASRRSRRKLRTLNGSIPR